MSDDRIIPKWNSSIHLIRRIKSLDDWFKVTECRIVRRIDMIVSCEKNSKSQSRRFFCSLALKRRHINQTKLIIMNFKRNALHLIHLRKQNIHLTQTRVGYCMSYNNNFNQNELNYVEAAMDERNSDSTNSTDFDDIKPSSRQFLIQIPGKWFFESIISATNNNHLTYIFAFNAHCSQSSFVC